MSDRDNVTDLKPGQKIALSFKDQFPSEYWALQNYKEKEKERENERAKFRIIYSFIAGWIITTFITFGWVLNHYKPASEVDHLFSAVFAGIFWPIYWLGKIAIFVTAWP